MSGRGEPTTGAGRALLADDWGAIGPEGMLTRILAIEAAAAREALEAVLEPVANAIYRALRAPSTIDETRYFDSLLAVDAAKLALGVDDSAQRGGEG